MIVLDNVTKEFGSLTAVDQVLGICAGSNRRNLVVFFMFYAAVASCNIFNCLV